MSDRVLATRVPYRGLCTTCREMLNDGEKDSVRVAVDCAIADVTEKHSLEFRFAIRWQHSLKTCLAMRLPYRSSDIYS